MAYAWVCKYHVKEQVSITLIYLKLIQAFEQRRVSVAHLPPAGHSLPNQNRGTPAAEAKPSHDQHGFFLSKGVSMALFHSLTQCQKALDLVAPNSKEIHLVDMKQGIQDALALFQKSKLVGESLLGLFHLSESQTFRTFLIQVLTDWLQQIERITDAQEDFLKLWYPMTFENQSDATFSEEVIPKRKYDDEHQKSLPSDIAIHATWVLSNALTYRFITMSKFDEEDKIPSRRVRLLNSLIAIYLAFSSVGDAASTTKSAQDLIYEQTGSETESNDLLQILSDRANSILICRAWNSPSSDDMKPDLFSANEIEEEIQCAKITIMQMWKHLDATDGRKRKASVFEKSGVDPPSNGEFENRMSNLPAFASSLYKMSYEPFTTRRIRSDCCMYIDESTIFPQARHTTLNDLNHGNSAATMGKLKRLYPDMSDLIENDDMCDWACAILGATDIYPTTALRRYFSIVSKQNWRKAVLPVLNRALIRASMDFLSVQESRLPLVYFEQKRSGEVLTWKDEESSSHEVLVLKGIIFLYYRAFEAMLLLETKRSNSFENMNLLHSKSLHRGILACCYICVTEVMAVVCRSSLTSIVCGVSVDRILEAFECSPFGFIATLQCFRDAISCEAILQNLSEPFFKRKFPFPILHRLEDAETQILDCLIWSDDWKIDQRLLPIIEFLSKIQYWPVKCLRASSEELTEYPERQSNRRKEPVQDSIAYEIYRVTSFIIEGVLERSRRRINTICQNVPCHEQTSQHAFKLFRKLLRGNTYLFRNRHVDHLILCCIYSVDRCIRRKESTTFSSLIAEYKNLRASDLGESICRRILHCVVLNEKGDTGNVILFYNGPFLSVARNVLLKNESLGRLQTSPLDEDHGSAHGTTD